MAGPWEKYGGAASVTPAPAPQAVPIRAAQRPQAARPQFASDLDAVTRTLIGEAGNQGEQGMLAVGGVIANRARQRGMSPSDVVLERNQFEPWGNVETSSRLMGVSPQSPEYQRAAQIASRALAGEDITGGASHFYAPEAQRALGRAAPSWDNGTGRPIGDHLFFNLDGGAQAPQAPPVAEQPVSASPWEKYANQNPDTPGSSRDAAIDLAKLYEDDIPRLVKGAWAKNGDEVFQLPGDAYQSAVRPSDENVGDQTYLRRPNATDTAGNFAMAAAEQIPFLDEAATGLSAALKGTDYSTEADNFRITRALGNQTDRGARVAGGLTGFGLGLAAPAAGLGYIGRAGSLGGTIGRSALVGAGSGALAGAGNTDGGFSERALGAGIGAGLGAGAGAVIPAVGAAAPRIASGLSEAGSTVVRGLGIAPREAEITPRATDSALRYVERLLESSGSDLLGGHASAIGKPITAAEQIGPQGVSNMAALSRRAGRTGNAMQAQIGARAMETPQRVVQDFADLTGMDPAGSADMVQNLAAAGRKRAAPLYEAAYATPIRITDDVQEILDTPAGKQAMRNAITIAQNERVDPTSLGFDFDAAGDVVHIRQPSVRTLDFVKRGLDDVLDGYRDSTTRRLNLTNESRPVVGLVTDLRDAMVRMTGGETGTYAQALAAGGDPIRLESAFRDAPKLFGQRTSLRDFRAGTARMGEGERNALAAGYANKLYEDSMGGRLGTRQLTQIDLPLTQQKLADLIGPDEADEFLSRVRLETDMARSGARMAPGTNSVTAEAMEAMRDQDRGVGILNDLARNVETSGVIGGATRTAADAVAAPVAGFIRGFQAPASQPVRDEIGRLLALDPQSLEAIIAEARRLSGSATQGGDGALDRVLSGQASSAASRSARVGGQSAAGSTRRSGQR